MDRCIAFTNSSGTTIWYMDNLRHRENGPAVLCLNGSVAWYQKGLRHRLDGPAVEYPSGRMEWWLDGVELTEEEHAKHILNERLTEQLKFKPIGKKVKI